MKRIATFMAAIVMLAASSVASADDFLWFSAEGSLPAGVTAVGGPGQSLSINKSLPGPATVRIGVNITSNTGGMNGWEISLLSSLGGSFANGLGAGSNYDLNFGGISNGSNIATFGRGSVAATGTVGLLYTFDLVLDGSLPVFVTGDFGSSQGVVKNNGLYWFGQVGNNPNSYGAANYVAPPADVTPGWGFNPVISVTPEPTTLVLLGMGAVALLRRRK